MSRGERAGRNSRLPDRASSGGARFVRLAEAGRETIIFTVDGRPVTAQRGDTLLTAILTTGTSVRRSDFGDGNRAGFCLMGACQDCWVWTAQGFRLRACTTEVVEGIRVLTVPEDGVWPGCA